MKDDEIKAALSELLMDVPLARGQGDPVRLLDALRRAALFYPVFRDWPSPVLAWIDEGRMLARSLGRKDEWALLGIRRAVALMRTGALDEALRELEDVQPSLPDLAPLLTAYAEATRSRIHTRRREFDAAAAAARAAAAVRVPAGEWIGLLPRVAEAELLLERGEDVRAAPLFRDALRRLPGPLVEERVQALQSLGFIAIAQADARRALRHLDAARSLLTAASVWPEVVQMNLVVASLELARGRTPRAEALLAEALAIAQDNRLDLWQPALQATLARARLAREQFAEAVESALQAATGFARQGNTLAYVAMILLLSEIRLATGDAREAYRVLSLGLAIARRLGLAPAEAVFKAQIDTLRNERLGPERFDAMVEEMLRERKGP